MPSQPLKPIILGEFGAEHAAYPQSSDAVAALVHWQIESCAYGFAGWLNWTWDTTEQPEFWNAREDDGAIEEAMAPITRPDPCAAGRVELPTDLAAGARATASHSIAGSGPAKAVDGLPTTIWNAGAGPVEWLQLDLRGTHRVDEIRLSVAQEPSGPTTHRVLVRGATGAWRVIATLRGMTSDGQVLVVHPSTALRGVRFVRIETTRSPSWVAWREVSVLGG